MIRRFALLVSLALLAPLSAMAQHLAPREIEQNPLPANADASRVQVVRANLARTIGTWEGVRDCARTSRAQRALRAAFERWVGQQARAHRGQTLLSSGWGTNRWYAENRRANNGRRRCKGGFRSAPVYARFY